MEIIQKGNPILRKKSKEVKLDKIPSLEIQNIIKEMRKTLEGEKTGAALASPQIGINKRIFIISEKIFEDKKGNQNLVYINPKIIKFSKKKEWLEESCLSIRGLLGEVKRFKNCVIVAYDENGKKFERGAGGLLAQIFQHEIDHLDGILFTDKAKNLREINQ